MLQQAGQPILAATINRQYTLADASNTTITGTSLANLCTAYSIAGSDAAQFTSYRLTCWGTGTWGSTQQILTLAAALAGTPIGAQPAIAATAFAASAAFSWKMVLTLMCCSTGTSGTWNAELSGWFKQNANPALPGTAADNSVPLIGTTGATDVTQDTTITNSLAVQAKWASATGAPTITTTNTMLERLAV